MSLITVLIVITAFYTDKSVTKERTLNINDGTIFAISKGKEDDLQTRKRGICNCALYETKTLSKTEKFVYGYRIDVQFSTSDEKMCQIDCVAFARIVRVITFGSLCRTLAFVKPSVLYQVCRKDDHTLGAFTSWKPN